MINLEQVKLLETKVAETIGYVERVSRENAALHQQEAELQQRLESYQKRIDELEVLIMGFKEEQGRIEDGFLSALDRLSQFVETIEKSLKEKHLSKADSPAAGSKNTAKPRAQNHTPPKKEALPQQDETPDGQAAADSGPFSEKIYFEISEDDIGDDILDPLDMELDDDADDGDSPDKGGELDIF